MTRARRRALVLACLIGLAVAAIGIAAIRTPPPKPQARPASERPALLLLTSLPLLFNEDFSLQGGGSPALTALQSHYRVVPISVADGAELAKGRLLLMAQPQAQAPENLVVLDQWVRRGGRLLLLADPLLEWPSKRPLGDLTRPPPMFADTGLLVHWGLKLDAPGRRGAGTRHLAGRKVLTASPGTLHGTCDVQPDQLVAECRVGGGRAMIVADADFMNVAQLGPGASENLDALLAALARLTGS
ncbi:MAG TPA: hypothetical protein VF750_05010 [Sphingomicrobium sp.]